MKNPLAFDNFSYQVEVCQSIHTKSWLSVLYAYKGLLLVVGVYMVGFLKYACEAISFTFKF